MDCAAFAARLPACFPAGDLFADTPTDRRFAGVVEQVDGMTTEHSLTLLNLAAALLGPEEIYLEVGSYRGRSLIGAALGQEHDRFVAIENFREFGVGPAESERLLRDALREWGVADRLRFLRGDAFRLLPAGAVDRRVGVYFYDGVHSRLAQYLALGMVEPLLADEALIVIDDASWPQVARTTVAYVARHPGYQLLFDLAADRPEDSRWCNGVTVLRWRRPAGYRAGPRLDLRWRRLAHLYLHEPAWHVAWNVLPRHPRLSAVLKRLYLHGGSVVPTPPGDPGRPADHDEPGEHRDRAGRADGC